MNATTILCILLLSLYLVPAVFWIVRSIIDTIDDRKREKRNAALETEREARNAKWEAERQQLELQLFDAEPVPFKLYFFMRFFHFAFAPVPEYNCE